MLFRNDDHQRRKCLQSSFALIIINFAAKSMKKLVNQLRVWLSLIEEKSCSLKFCVETFNGIGEHSLMMAVVEDAGRLTLINVKADVLNRAKRSRQNDQRRHSCSLTTIKWNLNLNTSVLSMN